MSELLSKDAEKILESVHELYRVTDLVELPQTIVGVLAKLVPSDAAAFNVIHADQRVEIVHNAPSLAGEVARRSWALEQFIDQHPLENFFKKTMRTEPVRISDFLCRKKFHDLPLYQEFYKHLGVEYQISVFLQQIDEFRIGIGVQRQDADFTDRDKEIIGHLARHIFQAYKNARAFTEVSHHVDQVHKAMATHQQGLIILNRMGKIESMHPWCEQRLAFYSPNTPRSTKNLPPTVQLWLTQLLQKSGGGPALRKPLVLRRDEGRLVIRMAEDGDTLMLLLTEDSLTTSTRYLLSLGLTKREAQVLVWIANAKSNAEIAIILGTSYRTIDKHAENIFRKLAVESRHAATLIALEDSGMRT
jgi:DNA-binding CsgD family transcriptional regulator